MSYGVKREYRTFEGKQKQNEMKAYAVFFGESCTTGDAMMTGRQAGTLRDGRALAMLAFLRAGAGERSMYGSGPLDRVQCDCYEGKIAT